MGEIKMNYNSEKIVIFDWGGVVESHKKGEYNIDVAIENLIKHFNPKETENIVERYYSRSIELGVKDIRNINDELWFEYLNEEFNLNCTPEEFYEFRVIKTSFFDKDKDYKEDC